MSAEKKTRTEQEGEGTNEDLNKKGRKAFFKEMPIALMAHAATFLTFQEAFELSTTSQAFRAVLQGLTEFVLTPSSEDRVGHFLEHVRGVSTKKGMTKRITFEELDELKERHLELIQLYPLLRVVEFLDIQGVDPNLNDIKALPNEALQILKFVDNQTLDEMATEHKNDLLFENFFPLFRVSEKLKCLHWQRLCLPFPFSRHLKCFPNLLILKLNVKWCSSVLLEELGKTLKRLEQLLLNDPREIEDILPQEEEEEEEEKKTPLNEKEIQSLFKGCPNLSRVVLRWGTFGNEKGVAALEVSKTDEKKWILLMSAVLTIEHLRVASVLELLRWTSQRDWDIVRFSSVERLERSIQTLVEDKKETDQFKIEHLSCLRVWSSREDVLQDFTDPRIIQGFRSNFPAVQDITFTNQQQHSSERDHFTILFLPRGEFGLVVPFQKGSIHPQKTLPFWTQKDLNGGFSQLEFQPACRFRGMSAATFFLAQDRPFRRFRLDGFLPVVPRGLELQNDRIHDFVNQVVNHSKTELKEVHIQCDPEIRGYRYDVFPHFEMAKNLKHLTIRFDNAGGTKTIEAADLNGLSGLESLQIEHATWSTSPTSRDISRFCQMNPNLEKLVLNNHHNDPTHLEVKQNVPLNLIQLEEDVTLPWSLPKLKELRWQTNSHTILFNDLLFMRQHCPALERCEFLYENKYVRWKGPPLPPSFEPLKNLVPPPNWYLTGIQHVVIRQGQPRPPSNSLLLFKDESKQEVFQQKSMSSFKESNWGHGPQLGSPKELSKGDMEGLAEKFADQLFDEKLKQLLSNEKGFPSDLVGRLALELLQSLSNGQHLNVPGLFDIWGQHTKIDPSLLGYQPRLATLLENLKKGAIGPLFCFSLPLNTEKKFRKEGST
jgi:hypothetical protein